MMRMKRYVLSCHVILLLVYKYPARVDWGSTQEIYGFLMNCYWRSTDWLYFLNLPPPPYSSRLCPTRVSHPTCQLLASDHLFIVKLFMANDLIWFSLHVGCMVFANKAYVDGLFFFFFREGELRKGAKFGGTAAKQPYWWMGKMSGRESFEHIYTQNIHYNRGEKKYIHMLENSLECHVA